MLLSVVNKLSAVPSHRMLPAGSICWELWVQLAATTIEGSGKLFVYSFVFAEIFAKYSFLLNCLLKFAHVDGIMFLHKTEASFSLIIERSIGTHHSQRVL
jgi:hypothetical protein